MVLDGDESECTGEWCGLFALLFGVVGAAVGETAGLAYGVHLTNGRQGNIWRDIAVSGLISALGIAVALETEEPRVLFAVPVVQLVGVIAAERR